MTEDRLTELETRIAFQEDLIQALNKSVGEHQQQLEKLETVCRVLLGRIKDQSNDAAAISPMDDVPPHY